MLIDWHYCYSFSCSSRSYLARFFYRSMSFTTWQCASNCLHNRLLGECFFVSYLQSLSVRLLQSRNRSYGVHSDLLPEILADWETVDIVREAECGGVVRSSMFDESGELRGDSEFVVEEWETIGPTPVVEVIEETSSSTVDPSESRTGGLFASTLAQVSNIWKAATGQN